MSTTTEGRVRAAAIRAKIIALLKSKEFHPFIQGEIDREVRSQLPDMNVSPKDITAALKMMARNSMVAVTSRKGEATNYRIPSPTNTFGGAKLTSPLTDINVLPVDMPVKKAEHLSISVVKSTGRVRIELGGMVIDIGVVNQ